eukprot:GDKI01040218.1.p2 GENE.GDKI01040218.1~~GDKI01040218.1.p2  ORF type:complete len:158 (-),score=42.83 GDKI01040218.1:224-697(-)
MSDFERDSETERARTHTEANALASGFYAWITNNIPTHTHTYRERERLKEKRKQKGRRKTGAVRTRKWRESNGEKGRGEETVKKRRLHRGVFTLGRGKEFRGEKERERKREERLSEWRRDKTEKPQTCVWMKNVQDAGGQGEKTHTKHTHTGWECGWQ